MEIFVPSVLFLVGYLLPLIVANVRGVIAHFTAIMVANMMLFVLIFIAWPIFGFGWGVVLMWAWMTNVKPKPYAPPYIGAEHCKRIKAMSRKALNAELARRDRCAGRRDFPKGASRKLLTS